MATLEAHGITAVLNIAGPVALKRKTINTGIQYKRITAIDEPDYPLFQNHWQDALDFIKSSTENGKGKYVVHCVARMNRSGLIVTAYYMLNTQTPVLETVKHLRKQRGNMALCNEGFSNNW
jgi:protein-tyrosine phosphatase